MRTLILSVMVYLMMVTFAGCKTTGQGGGSSGGSSGTAATDRVISTDATGGLPSDATDGGMGTTDPGTPGTGSY